MSPRSYGIASERGLKCAAMASFCATADRSRPRKYAPAMTAPAHAHRRVCTLRRARGQTARKDARRHFSAPERFCGDASTREMCTPASSLSPAPKPAMALVLSPARPRRHRQRWRRPWRQRLACRKTVSQFLIMECTFTEATFSMVPWSR